MGLFIALVLVACPQDVQELQALPACADSLQDQSNPGGRCLEASFSPMLGKLYPLSQWLFVDPLGHVGMGTIHPTCALHVLEFGAQGPVILGSLLNATPDPFAAAVRGEVPSASGQGIGVWGDHGGIGLGVYGSSFEGAGVVGTHLATSGLGVGVLGTTHSESPGAVGVTGRVQSTNAGSQSAGVKGDNNGTGSDGYGVLGIHDGGGDGVRGTSQTGVGVFGVQSGTGSGPSFGVIGQAYTANGGSGGVLGQQNNLISGFNSAGVIGRNNGTNADGFGVLGTHAARGVGVRGESEEGPGVSGSSTTSNGVVGATASPSRYGVFANGDFGGTGAKYFVQPHPTDAAREIRFVSLEGNESGTYFRGSIRLRDGRATIEVPEEFRLASEPGHQTVQLTAVGARSALWVESKSLERIVIHGDRDVRVDYFVNGVRRGYADFEPLRANQAFVPADRGVPYGAQFRPGMRRILVENGILNADFTPNEETAARLGWTLRTPEEITPEPVPAPAPPRPEAPSGAGPVDH